MAFDCSDGGVRIWEPASNRIQELHRHTDLSFGIALQTERVCSGSWDGRIICSMLDGSRTQTLLEGFGRIRWLIGSRDQTRLFVATDDGGIWKLDDGPQVLFRHNQTPYRISVSSNGKWLASGAFDGTLIVYDVTAGQVIFRQIIHHGRITTVIWDDSDLWTAGVDSEVKQWRVRQEGIDLVATYHESDSVKLVSLAEHDTFLAVAPNTLKFRSAGNKLELEFKLQKSISDIQESSDHRYVAVTSFQEIVIIDKTKHMLSTLHTDSGSMQCVKFISPSLLGVCGRSSILTVDLSNIRYFPYLQ